MGHPFWLNLLNVILLGEKTLIPIYGLYEFVTSQRIKCIIENCYEQKVKNNETTSKEHIIFTWKLSFSNKDNSRPTFQRFHPNNFTKTRAMIWSWTFIILGIKIIMSSCHDPSLDPACGRHSRTIGCSKRTLIIANYKRKTNSTYIRLKWIKFIKAKYWTLKVWTILNR